MERRNAPMQPPPPRTPNRSPSRASVDTNPHDDYHLAPEPSHPAPPSPAFTNSTIYRTPDESYSDAETDLGDGIATPVTLSAAGDNDGSPRPSHDSLRYEDLPPSYEEAQAQSLNHQGQHQRVFAYEQQQQQQHVGSNPLSPPPPFAHTASAGSTNSSDPVLPAVERLVLREKERAASEHEQGSETRSAFSGNGSNGDDAAGGGGRIREGLSFTAIEGLASEHHGALEVALQWAHPAYHAGDIKEPVASPLPRPVVVPQVNPRSAAGVDDESPDLLSFARAYAPLLHAHGISVDIFLAFLDGLNAVCHAARAPASDDACEEDEPDLSLVESYLARANALFFAHRALVVRVVDVEGLLDDVLRISASRRSLRDALAHDVGAAGASERDRVDALDPWVERLVWDDLPPQMLGVWDLRGHQEQSPPQQQQQRTTGVPLPPAAATVAPTTTTTNAYASGEFYNVPEGVAGGYLDEKAQYHHQQQQQQQPDASSSSSRHPFFPPHILTPLPPLTPLPGFGPFPPAAPPPFGDHARWADWGQGLGRRWADWGQKFGQGWAQWGQEVGNRAAAWGQEVGDRAGGHFAAGGGGRSNSWGGAGAGGRGGGGPWGGRGAGPWGGRHHPFMAGPGGGGMWPPPLFLGRGGPCGPYGRGFGFAGRGFGGRGGGGPGMGGWGGRGAGHQLRGGWGGAGAGPTGQYGTFGPAAQPEDGGAGEAGSARNAAVPNESSSTLNTNNDARISLEDNDADSSSSSSSSSDDESDNDSCAFDEIELAHLKRVRSIDEAASDALAKGKRSRADVEREREKAMERALFDREKALRKREAKRMKEQGKKAMKAKRKEWKSSRRQGGGCGSEEGPTDAAAGKKERKEARKREKKRIKKEYAEAKRLWWEGRRAEMAARRDRRGGRRRGGDGGGGGGGGCGARNEQAQAQQQQQQDRGLEVGVVANEEGARAGVGAEELASTPQLLWVVVENLEG